MQIHTKIISIFSSTPPGSPQEPKIFPSPDIIHLSDSKELFLICLLIFSFRLRRPTPTPPAIIILTSLCLPWLIASRIKPIFCRRKNKPVKKKVCSWRQGERKKKKKENENILPSSVHKYR